MCIRDSLVGALGRHRAVIHHQNQVGVHDGRHPLGHDELGGSRQILPERLTDLRIRGSIHGAGGIVQKMCIRDR